MDEEAEEDYTQAMKRMKMGHSSEEEYKQQHQECSGHDLLEHRRTNQTPMIPPPGMASTAGCLRRAVTAEDELSTGSVERRLAAATHHPDSDFPAEYQEVNSLLAQLHQQRLQRNQGQQPQSHPTQPEPELYMPPPQAHKHPTHQQPYYQPRKIKLPCDSKLG